MNQEVRKYIINVCRKRETATYTQLNIDCNLGFNLKNIEDRFAIGKVIGDISRYEHSLGRPLISSIITRAKTNRCGPGFFTMAEELGFGPSTMLQKNNFDLDQISKSHLFWANNDNFSKYF